jgi:hypothetical protein
VIGPKVPKPTPAESRAAHAAVSLRSGGRCEVCGKPASDRHHRRHGAAGRADTVDNLLDLCGGPGGLKGGNHSGHHGAAHGPDGRLLGWSVNNDNDPADIPVYVLHRDVWTLRGEPIPHATAVAILFRHGVIASVEQYVAWFTARRAEWALEVTS